MGLTPTVQQALRVCKNILTEGEDAENGESNSDYFLHTSYLKN